MASRPGAQVLLHSRPYGLADYRTLIRDGFVYLDRTQHIREIEDLGRHLLFVRPRRFGKSLWLSTLAN